MRDLRVWTIYKSPMDFPGKFVARLFLNGIPTTSAYPRPSYDEVMSLLPKNLLHLPRVKQDAPSIVESWMER